MILLIGVSIGVRVDLRRGLAEDRVRDLERSLLPNSLKIIKVGKWGMIRMEMMSLKELSDLTNSKYKKVNQLGNRCECLHARLLKD